MRAVLASTWGPTHKKYLGAFLDTAKRNGLDPQNFDATDWEGGGDWTKIPWYRKSEGQARFVRDTRGQYDVYLFTDSMDVVFAAGWEEILRKFSALDSPIVCAAESYPWPDINQAGLYPATHHRCRYLNAGMWIAVAEAAEMFANDLSGIAARREKCDQQISVDLFLGKKHPIKLDTACSLMFCLNLDSPSYLDMSGARPRTTDTGEEPVMFHANGNSNLIPICQKIAP